MSILVVGKTGQLASHLREELPEAEYWGRDRLDWTSQQDYVAEIVDYRPQVIINATAYTAVDLAESEPGIAYRVNALGPAALAEAAHRCGATLIHVSTDYVFNGESAEPYSVSAATRPNTTYGRSKLAGEQVLAASGAHCLVVRTSWVFSEFGNNFVKTMLSLGQRDALTIVADQRGRPTYAKYLAQTIATLAAEPSVLASGVYHFSGGPAVSWYEFATHIFDQAGHLGLLERVPILEPVDSSQYPTVARRPLNSVLAPSMELMALAPRRDWEQGLSEVLPKIV